MIDLGAAADRLRAEPHGAGGGHRSQMLILAPGIPHSLTAEVQSDLLVTIRLRQ